MKFSEFYNIFESVSEGTEINEADSKSQRVFDFNADSDDPIYVVNPKKLAFIINSIIEEAEAIKVYNERISKCNDSELYAVLSHNRDEEAEHLALLIAQLIRVYPTFAEAMENALDEISEHNGCVDCERSDMCSDCEYCNGEGCSMCSGRN